MNLAINVNTPAHAMKKKHQIGNCHQSGDSVGEKSRIIFTKIRLGRAISRARGESRPRMSPGRIRFLIIQKPKIPIPKRTATDSNVVINTDTYSPLLVFRTFFCGYQRLMHSQKVDFALSVSILGALKIFPASAGPKPGVIPSNSWKHSKVEVQLFFSAT